MKFGSKKSNPGFDWKSSISDNFETDGDFLSAASARMLSLEGEEIYRFVARTIHRLAGDCIAAVASYHKEDDDFLVRAVEGLKRHQKIVTKLMRKDPVGMDVKTEKQVKEILSHAKVEKVHSNLHSFTKGGISEKVALTIKKVLGLGNAYVVGLVERGEIFGALGIIMRGSREIANKEQIQSFVNLAAIAVQRDIARENSKLTEKRYHTIFENTGTAMIVIEEDTTISNVNRTGKILSGYSREEIIGKSWTDFIAPADIQRMQKFHKARRKDPSSAPPSYGFKLKTKSGKLIDTLLTIELIPNTNKTIASLSDISELKRTKVQVDKEKERGKHYLDIVGVIIVAFDTDGNITMLNKHGREVLGGEDDEFLGKNWFETCLPEENREYGKIVFRHLLSGKEEPVKYFENQIITKDGKKRTIQWHNKVLYNDDNEITGILSSGEDITDIRQSEKELRKERIKIEQLHEVSAKLESARTREEVYEIAVLAARKTLDFEIASIIIPEGEKFVTKSTTDTSQHNATIPRGQGICGKTYRTGKSFVVPNVPRDKAAKPTNIDYRSTISVPIGSLGVFQAHSKELGHFTKSDLKLTELLVFHLRETLVRIKSNESIQRSEKKYRNLIETTNTGFLIVDEKGIVMDANEEYIRLSGHKKPDEIMGKSVIEWTAEHDVERNKKEIAKCLKRGYVRDLEIDYIDKNGKITPIEVNASVAPTGGKKWITAICRDITRRVDAQKGVEKERKFYKDFVESVDDWIWEMDTEGVHTYSNPAVEKVLGYTADEVVGKHTTELWYEPHRNPVNLKKLKDRLEEGKGWKNVPCRFKYRDGSLVYLESTGLPIFDPQGNLTGYRGIDRDITKWKEAKEVIEKSEKFLDTIFETIQDGISVLETNLDIRFVNGIMKEWYSENMPLEGKKCYQVYHNKEQPCDPCPTIRCLETGKTEREVVMGLEGSDAEWIELYSYPIKNEKTGEISGIVEFVRDITERKKAEEALRKSKERLSNIVESSTNLFYSHTANHKLTYLSPRTKEFLQCEPEEAMVKWTEFVTDNPINEKGLALTRKAIETGEQQLHYELELRGKKGKKIWVEVREAPVVVDGKTIRIVGSLTDITARKKARKELESSLREKTALLQEVHHRVKNNMQVISSLLNIQSQRLGEDEASREIFANSRNMVMAMALVHEALYRSENLSEISFTGYLGKLGKYLRRTHGNKRKIQLFMPENEIEISVPIQEAVPVGLTVSELISNSYLHGFPKGEKGKIEVDISLEEENIVKIVVEDNGIGLPEDFKIEELDSLGLKLVRDTVKKQLLGELIIGGKDGARFEIRFPLKEPKKKFN